MHVHAIAYLLFLNVMGIKRTSSGFPNNNILFCYYPPFLALASTTSVTYGYTNDNYKLTVYPANK